MRKISLSLNQGLLTDRWRIGMFLWDFTSVSTFDRATLHAGLTVYAAWP